MKTATIDLDGLTYITCFSTRVLANLIERYGDETAVDKMLRNPRFNDLLFVMHEMLKAGGKYAEKNGLENPPIPSYDDFLDFTTPDDLKKIGESVGATMAAGTQREVEIQTKKGKATQRS